MCKCHVVVCAVGVCMHKYVVLCMYAMFCICMDDMFMCEATASKFAWRWSRRHEQCPSQIDCDYAFHS
jgi:hypothetical protein